MSFKLFMREHLAHITGKKEYRRFKNLMLTAKIPRCSCATDPTNGGVLIIGLTTEGVACSLDAKKYKLQRQGALPVSFSAKIGVVRENRLCTMIFFTNIGF